jgi:hypothetical protein
LETARLQPTANEHSGSVDEPPTKRRMRTLLIGGVIAALLIAVGVPLGVHQAQRAALAEEAREAAAALASAFEAADAARSDYEAGLAGAAAFSEQVLAPAAGSVTDPSQFSEEAVAMLQEQAAHFAEYGSTAVEGPDRPESASEETLVQAYLEAEDIETERDRVAEELAALRAQTSEYETATSALETSTADALAALRVVAEVGSEAGDATLAAHARASEDSRAGLAAAVQALRDLSAALNDPDISAVLVSEELQAASMLGSYASSTQGVRASQAEVLAAEAAAAEAAARQAAQAAPRASNPGSGTRLCTYLGFGGAVNIKPC